MTQVSVHGDRFVLHSTRHQVWYDASTVFVFYVNASDAFSYIKSTDAGATWGTEVPIQSAGGCVDSDIFYERWTNVANDPIVHLAYHYDSVPRGIYYRQLNLATEVLTAAVYAYALPAAPADGSTSVGVARNGDIHLSSSSPGASQHYISTDGGTSFVASGATLNIAYGEQVRFWPDASSVDTADMIALWDDTSATQVVASYWDDSAGTWTDVVVDSDWNGLAGNASAYNRTNGHIEVIIFDNDATPNTLRAWDIYGATVTAKTNVLTEVADTYEASLSVSPEGYVFAAYARGSGSSGIVYYKKSTDGMVTWGAETAYSTVAYSVAAIIADPAPGASVYLPVYQSGSPLNDLYVETPAVSTPVEQYRLMLSDGADPDIPVTNITPDNIGSAGATLIRTERGRESAVLGRPPRAGQATALINNVTLGYGLDQPTPGLALRLNKKYSGTWYNLWHGNLDIPEHHMGGFRPVITVRALGPLTKLSDKKGSTALYQNITTGQAIGYLLDAVDFPSSLRDIDTGDVTLPYWWMNDEDAVSALLKIVNSEGITAELYEQGDGKLVFRSRSARYSETRSTAIQNTFRNTNTDPRLNSFQYTAGYREIVNFASHERYRRTNDTGLTVVWDDVPGFTYIVPPNGSIQIEAVAAEPFFDAVVPVASIDYLYGFDAPTVSLERLSGQRTKITFTSGAGGTTLTGLQLRAYTTINNATYVERSSIDAETSIAAYGLRAWSGEMSKELSWADMRDNLDAIVSWKKDPRGRIRISYDAASGSVANQATAQREIGDRIRVIETALDFDGEVWIERIEHEVKSPAGPADGSTLVGSEITAYECSVIAVAVGSSGSGVGETSPYATINNGAYVSPESGVNEDHGIPTRGASIF